MQAITVDCDPTRMNLEMIHAFLTQSYWARGIPKETVRRSMQHSINFGLFQGEQQIGFARCVSDRATFAYLGDVFLLPEFRGQGLGKQLMGAVMAHPELQSVRRWMLATHDAHGLYSHFNFKQLTDPSRLMERIKENPYPQS